jgi:signal transduction histidine kinase
VTKHGGSIDVQSQLNQGTEFLIRLPIDSWLTHGLTYWSIMN